MKQDNVIEFPAHRGRISPEEAAARSAQRDLDHSQKATHLLEALRTTKRLKDHDRRMLVSNLGGLVDQLEPKSRMALAQRILLPANWPKRMRYIRFPNENSDQSARYASS